MSAPDLPQWWTEPPTPFFAEHAARQARLHEPSNWSWPGEPWPWCPSREVPHDAHRPGGCVVCPGRAGMIPPTPVQDQQERLAAAEADVQRARSAVERANRELARAERGRDEAERLVQAAWIFAADWATLTALDERQVQA